MAKLHVCGHLKGIVNRLLNKISQQSWRRTWQGVELECNQNVLGGYAELIDEQKCISNDIPIKPQRLMGYLSTQLPEDTRFFIDAGNIWAWATHYLTTSNNSGCYRIAMGFGSMAWSMGAVIGSAMASPDKPHVCLIGDGAWQMSSHEIGVAVDNKLPILFIVLNDSAYGMVKFGQRMSNAEQVGWKLNQVDFALLAQAQGADGYIFESPQELMALDIHAVFNKDVPTVLDIRIDSNEIPPMMDRVKSLQEGAVFLTGNDDIA
jgi:acetolactate synthase-1/2/3 large subunit